LKEQDNNSTTQLNQEVMDQEPIKVEKDLYVNAATLELLQRRMASEVKANFFYSIGAPVGGAGILAILFVLFIWVPRTIHDYVSKDEQIQSKLKAAVQSFLDGEEGREFVRAQITNSTTAYLTSKAQQLVAQPVKFEVEEHFKSTGGRQILQMN